MPVQAKLGELLAPYLNVAGLCRHIGKESAGSYSNHTFYVIRP